jgi:putative ABC transport system permease protein
VRQFVAEGLVLALMGGTAGLLVARAALDVVLRLIPNAVPRLSETSMDSRVLTVAVGLTFATAMVFGVAPALSLWRTNALSALKDSARVVTASAGRLHTRRLLVVVEFALAVLLLVGAALLIKSLWRITAYPEGFSPDRVLTMKVQFTGPRYRDLQQRRGYLTELLERARSAPGVQAAGISSNWGTRLGVIVEGAPQQSAETRVGVPFTVTSAGYAAALGMRVLKGRWFSEHEASPSYVINEALARRHFPNTDPIGKRILLPNEDPKSARFIPIIGVVADLRYANLEAAVEPELFIDYAQTDPPGMTLAIRTTDDPATAAPSIRALLTNTDRTLPLFEVKPLDEVLANSIAARRFNMMLLATFAGSALLLALIGIYGLIAYSVAQRTHEIGVRVALGAGRRDVVRMVVRQGLAIVTVGMIVGIGAALALTRFMSSLLYEISPTDPWTFAVVVGTLSITALAACCGPAIRAARVDPMVALRCD